MPPISQEVVGITNSSVLNESQNILSEFVRFNKYGDRFAVFQTYAGHSTQIASQYGSINSSSTTITSQSDGLILTKRSSLGALQWIWNAEPNVTFANSLYTRINAAPIYCDNDRGVIIVIKLDGEFTSFESSVTLTDVNNNQTTLELLTNNSKSARLLVHFNNTGTIINTCLFNDSDPIVFDTTSTRPQINGVAQLPNGNILIASSFVKNIKTASASLTIANVRSLTNVILGTNGSLTLWQTFSYNRYLDGDTSDDILPLANYNIISTYTGGFVVLTPFEMKKTDPATSNGNNKTITIMDSSENVRTVAFSDTYDKSYTYILTKYDNNLVRLWESAYELSINQWLGTDQNDYPMISALDGSITIHNTSQIQDDNPELSNDLNVFVNGVKTTYVLAPGTVGTPILRFASNGTFLWYYMSPTDLSNNVNYFNNDDASPNSMMYNGDVFIVGKSQIDQINSEGTLVHTYPVTKSSSYYYATITHDDSLLLAVQVILYDGSSFNIALTSPINFNIAVGDPQQLVDLYFTVQVATPPAPAVTPTFELRFAGASNSAFNNTKPRDIIMKAPAGGSIHFGDSNAPLLSFTPTGIYTTGVVNATSVLVAGQPISLSGVTSNVSTSAWKTGTGGSNIYVTDCNVGIGTTHPEADLHVIGTTTLEGTLVVPKLVKTNTVEFTDVSNTQNSNLLVSSWINDSNVLYTNKNVAVNKTSSIYELEIDGDINFTSNLMINGNVYTGADWLSTSNNVYIGSSSNIGINTSNPIRPIHVVGDINVSGSILKNGAGLSSSQWNNQSSNVYLLSSNVGIGTTQPQTPLHVVGNIGVSGNIIPAAHHTYSIGTSNKRIKDFHVESIHLGSNTLYLGDTPILGTNQDVVQITASTDQNITVRTQGTGNMSVLSVAGQNVSTSGLNAQVQVQASGPAANITISATQDVNVTAPTLNVTGSTTITSNAILNGNVTVTGNTSVTGSNFIANTASVEISDNTIVVNKGQVGSGITAGKAGIAIDRGDAARVEFVFEEASQSFKMGSVGATEIVASASVMDSNYVMRNSLANLTNKATALNNLGLGTSCNVTFASVDAVTLQVGGSNLDSLYVGIGISNIAYSASNTAFAISGNTSNVVYSTSNQAFNGILLTGGNVVGTITGTTINATELQQGGVAVGSLYAGIGVSNVAHLSSNAAYSASNTAFTFGSFSNNSSNIFLDEGMRLGLGGNSNPTYTLDVTGDVNYTGTLYKNGLPITQSTFSSWGSNIYLINSNLGIGISNPITPLQVAGNILPAANEVYDLGSSNLRWRDLYISSNTINLGGVLISSDSNDNILIRDANNNTKRLIVDEIQIIDNEDEVEVAGQFVPMKSVRLGRGNAGANSKFNIVRTSNSIDTVVNYTSNVVQRVSISNFVPRVVGLSSSNGFIQNVLHVPEVDIDYIGDSAGMFFGRVTLNGYNGISLSNTAEISLMVNHTIGHSNYLVFSTPDNANLKVGFSGFSSNSFLATVKNMTGSNLVDPSFNYMIVRAAKMVKARSALAQPVSLAFTSCNIFTVSGPATAIGESTNFVITGVSDPQGFDISYAVASNVSRRFAVNSSNLVYTFARSNSTTSVAVNPRNTYNEDSTKLINYTVTETYLTEIGLSNVYNSTVNSSNVNSIVNYSFPGSFASVPLVYTYNSNLNAFNGSNVTISSSNLTYYTAGSNMTYNFYISARYANDIMTRTGLNSKPIILTINEIFATSYPIADYAFFASSLSSLTTGATITSIPNSGSVAGAIATALSDGDGTKSVLMYDETNKPYIVLDRSKKQFFNISPSFSTSFANGGAMTIAMRVKITGAFSQYSRLWQIGPNTNEADSLYGLLGDAAHRVIFGTKQGANNVEQRFNDFVVNNLWMNIVIVIQNGSTSTQSTYLNNALVETTTGLSALTDRLLTHGGIGKSLNPNDAYLNGHFAAFMIYRRSLNTTEIGQLNSYLDSLTAPTQYVAYDFRSTSSYPGTGTALTDISGNGVNATFTSAPGYSSSPKFVDFIPTRRASTSAVTLNLSRGYSVEILFRLNNVTSSKFLISYVVSRNVNGIQLQIIDDFIYLYNANTDATLKCNITLVQNVWYHMVATSDGLFYVNGEAKTVSTVSWNTKAWVKGGISITSRSLTLGDIGGTNSIDGSVVYAGVYNIPLIHSVIVDRYNTFKANGNVYNI